MIDLSKEFHPVPKDATKVRQECDRKVLKKKSSKLAKLEKNRFSIITDKTDTCYMCHSLKEDWHEVIEGKNRQTSIKYRFSNTNL